MQSTSPRRKYFTQEKRQLIVEEHYSSGLSVPVLARKYGIHAITLYGWKRQMRDKKEIEELSPDLIKKLIEENDRLKAENKNLLAKVGDLSMRNEILKDGMEIVQKKALLKALQSPKKSKKIKSIR